MMRVFLILFLSCLVACTGTKQAKLADAISRSEALCEEKRFSEAMTTCSEAEELAQSLDDQYSLGLIYRTMAHISNATYGFSDEIRYLNLSSAAFKSADKPYNSLHVDFEKGLACYNSGDYASAERVYRNVLYRAHESADTLLEARCLSAYAALSVETAEPDPVLAIEMLSRAATELKCPLSSSDLGILAYAYSLIGRNEEAEKMALASSRAASDASEKAKADFRIYQVRSRAGLDSEALKSLESVMEYSNSVEMASLRRSVASSRRDYLDQQHSLTRQRLSSVRHTTAFLICAFIAIVFALIGYIRYRRLEAAKALAEEKAETEKYMGIAEDLQIKLKTASKRLPSEKHLSIAKFDMLERLCEQYYIYEGTSNLQDKILKEVKAVIEGLRNDPKMLTGLELMLDRNCDEVVSRLRKQLPKLKEDDIRLYIFAASGFSSTTISTILEKEKGVIYNRIWRLKTKISSSEAPDKDDFLHFINA